MTELNKQIYWFIGGLFFIVLLIVGIMLLSSSDQQVNGMTPEDVVIKYENAWYQEDQKTMYNLLVPEDRVNSGLDPSQGPKNSYTIQEGTLKKYQVDSSTIYYEFDYHNPKYADMYPKTFVKVVLTSEGWRRYFTVLRSEFERETAGIEPEIIEVKP